MNLVQSHRNIVQKTLIKKTLFLILTLLVMSGVAQNDVPISTGPDFKSIPAQTVKEGSSFSELNIAKYFTNTKKQLKKIKVTISGNKELRASINAKKIIKVKAPNKEWNGTEILTIKAVDAKGVEAITTVDYVVESVNDSPVVRKISGQKIREGSTFREIDLKTLVKDIDHTAEEIEWSASVESKGVQRDGDLDVVIDANKKAMINIPDAEWYGTADITFTATDLEGATAAKMATFVVKSVNDKPVIQAIPNQVINEGEEFGELALSDFITDSDHEFEKLKFSTKGGKELTVKISDGIVSIKTPGEQFSGRPETITITVEDPEKGKATSKVVFEVKEINDAPEFSEMPSLIIDEGQKFKKLDLSKYVTDVDHKLSQLKWNVMGNKELKVQISGSSVAFKLPSVEWNGEENITIRATDPVGASAETMLTLTVNSINDLPVLKSIKGQKIKEGQTFKDITLDKFISDADHKKEEIAWSYEVKKIGKSYQDLDLDVMIDNNRVAKILVPDTNFHGNAKIEFIAEDPDGAIVKTLATMAVESVNDKPVAKVIGDQIIEEGSEFMEISLDDFVLDADHEPEVIKWSVKGGKKLKVTIDKATRTAIVKVPNEEFYCAPEKLTFTATDPEGAKSSIAATFEVKSINDEPELAEIPGQLIDEGQKFKRIDLVKYIKDIDNKFSDFKIELSGFNMLTAKLSGSKLDVVAPSKFWNGEEVLNLKAIDGGGAFVETQITYTVNSINNIPQLKKIKSQKVKEGSVFKVIELDALVRDDDHKKEELLWTVEATTVKSSDDGELLVALSTDRVATITTPHENWYGKAKITFVVEDPDGGTQKTVVPFEVTSVNDKPTLSDLTNQSVDEGGQFTSVNLMDLVKDADHTFENLVWSVKGGKKLKMEIDDGVAQVAIPNSEWSGRAETFTITVTDPEKGKASTKVTFTVNSINDLPVMRKIASQKIKEGQQFNVFNMKDLVEDVDHAFNKLKFNISGNNSLKFKISGGKVSIKSPNKDWFGTETVTFSVTDPEGASVSQTAIFSVLSVNDIPIIKKVKGQKIKEGKQFKTIALSKLVTDNDHSVDQLVWSWKFSKTKKGTVNPIVELDGGTLKISTPNDNWYGARTLVLTVKDPDGGSASTKVNLEATSVNDLPVLLNIADAAVNEGGSFKSFDLNALVSDADHSDKRIKWSFEGAKNLKIIVNKKNRASVIIPNKNWFGKERITFKATDPDGGVAKQKIEFDVISVNDEPVLSKIKSQTINEGGSFKEVLLDKFVTDADHTDSKLKWSLSGNSALKIRLSGRKLKVETPSSNWFGSETFTLTVKDPDGAQKNTSVSYTVRSINDKPIVKSIKSQTIKEGASFRRIKLDDFVKDGDHKDEQIKWTYSIRETPKKGKKKKKKKSKKLNPAITVSIVERVATIQTPSSDWFGGYDIIFTAIDPEKAKASTRATFTVTSVNDAPVLKSIPDQIVKEGKAFTTIKYNDYVSDADHSKKSLAWEIKGNKKLKVIRNSKKGTVLIKAPNSNWYGKEKITFYVRDKDGGKAKVTTIFEKESVNDAPTLNKIKSQTIKEGGAFAKMNLNALVNDVDHKGSQLKWRIDGNKELIIKSTGSKLIVKAPSKNWFGKETLTFTVTDPEGATATKKATFTVKSVNDVPVLKAFKGQKIKEGSPFREIDLDSYVTDNDHDKDQLKWTFAIVDAKGKKKKKKRGKKSKPEITVNISKDRVATIKTPGDNWYGQYDIIFAVTDPDKAKSRMRAPFVVTSVNDLPVIKGIKDQYISEGKSFKSIKLNNFVGDADHSKKSLKWSFSGNKKLKVNFNKKKRTVSVTTPNKNWYGREKITFQVKDGVGGKDKQSVIFEVESINDKPVFNKVASQKINEGGSFKKIDLNALVTDIDHKDSQLKWSITGNKELKLKTSGAKLQVTPPSNDWYGKETITFTVKDPEGATVSQKAVFAVKSINDKPVFKKVKGQKIKEGSVFKSIDLKKYLSDSDNKFSSLKIVANKKTKKKVHRRLKLSIDKKGVASIQIPDENWYGKETHTITAIDPAKAKASISITFEVTSVNDKPEIYGIEDQTINEGKSFKAIVLSNHVEDVDDKNSKIKWSITGNKKLKITRKKGKVFITPPSKRWSGPTERIKFTAKDPKGAKHAKVINFTVNRINRAPVISKIKSQTIKEGSKFTLVSLDKFVKDRDDKDNRLFWFVEGGGELGVEVDYNRRLVVTVPHENWFGKETIKLTCQDSEGAKSTTKITYTVKSVNDAPRALSDNYSTDEGRRLKVSKKNGVLANDSDPDGPKPKKAKIVKKPKNGKLKFKTDGSFVYTPKRGFSGDDSFAYKAKDKHGKYSPAVDVDITVYFKLQDIRK